MGETPVRTVGWQYIEAAVKNQIATAKHQKRRESQLKKTLAAAEKAAAQGAQIICTQELFRSQYFCQSEDYNHFQLAEPIPGPTTKAFQKLAKQKQVVVIASVFEKKRNKLERLWPCNLDPFRSHPRSIISMRCMMRAAIHSR